MRAAAPARHATPRRPDRATFGPAAGKVARALGLELDPWQQHIMDVALEVTKTGQLAYPEVRLSVGRQNGKTLLALVAIVDRMLAGERRGWGHRQHVLYGAQTGGDARKKMLEDWEPILSDDRCHVPWDAKRDMVKSNGREAFRLGNARCYALYTGKSSGHGGTNDLVVLDEAWHHKDSTLEVGARPTLLTRTHDQVWVMSAAGATAEESPYWWDKLDDLRERSEARDWGRVAGFEWAAPDGLDRDDTEAWHLAIPALACGRITIDTVHAFRDNTSDGDFDRSILNRWGVKGDSLFDLAKWAACGDPAASPGTDLHFAVDVAPGPGNGRSAAIVAAGWSDPHVVVEVVAHQDGTEWVKDELARLVRTYRPRSVSYDPGGPVRAIVDDIRSCVPARRILEVTAAEVVGAAQSFHEAAHHDTLRHLMDPRLTAAVEGAAKRMVGDSWAFRRRESRVDICPLVAASLARRAAYARRGALVDMV